MSAVRTASYSLAMELLPELYTRFCRLYKQKLRLQQRAHVFQPTLWWGKPQHTEVWTRAARFLQAQTEPWPEFLGWLFKSGENRNRLKLPHPRQLSSKPTWHSFLRDYYAPDYQAQLDQRMRLDLEHQKGQLLMGAVEALDLRGPTQQVHDGTREGMQRWVLLGHLEMTPLFRYCVACQENLPDVAQVWQQLALEQYEFYAPVYDRTWQDLLSCGELQLKGGC